jgi:predicted DCC family thiol-disulfide oxidoreductase YuxK
MCLRTVEQVRRPLERRGFRFVAQQSDEGRKALGLAPNEVASEVKVRTAGGKLLGGSTAFLHIARFVWWLKPLLWLSKVPGARWIIDRVYRWVTANRYCITKCCRL